MKKHWKLIVILSALAYSILTLSSCATIVGGPITEHQANRPGPGEPPRQIRPVPLIANVLLFWPGVFIDLATGAAYKPYKEPAKLGEGNYYSKEQRTIRWNMHREHLKASRALRKLEKSEGPEGFTFEQMQTIDSLQKVMEENPKIK